LPANITFIDMTQSPLHEGSPLQLEDPLANEHEGRASPISQSPNIDKKSNLSPKAKSSPPEPIVYHPPKKKRRLRTPEPPPPKRKSPSQWSVESIRVSQLRRLTPSEPAGRELGSHESDGEQFTPISKLIKCLDTQPEHSFQHNLSQEDELSFARNPKLGDSPKSTWECEHCTFKNSESSMMKCRMCHRVRELISVEKWACTRCTYANSMDDDECKICHFAKCSEKKNEQVYAFQNDSSGDQDYLFFTQPQEHVKNESKSDEVIPDSPPPVDSADENSNSATGSPLNNDILVISQPLVRSEPESSCDDHLSDLNFETTPSPEPPHKMKAMRIKLGLELPSPLKENHLRDKRIADLKALSMPQLKKEAAKFGLGPGSKGLMVQQLIVIWDNKNLDARTKKKLLQVPNSPAKSKKKRKNAGPSAKEKKELEFRDFEQKLCEHLRGCDEWYEKILLFRSIDYDKFSAYVKEVGLNPPSDKALKDILDKHGVTYATGSGKKRHERKRNKKFWWGRKKGRGRGRGRGRRGRPRARG